MLQNDTRVTVGETGNERERETGGNERAEETRKFPVLGTDALQKSSPSHNAPRSN